jgi:hypothetical protein
MWLPALGSDVDAAWQWSAILSLEPSVARDACLHSPLGVEQVVAVVDGEPQGLMVTSLPNVSPLVSQSPASLYVEYVAAAPWNRDTSGQARSRFLAVGYRLLVHAVLRSVARGRGGRLGLHADGGRAADYYVRRGLRSCGADPEEEAAREYFEGDATWADAFLRGSQR